MAKTIATIKGTMLAPGISKNNRMYTTTAIGRMVTRMKERLNDPNALPVVMRTHHDAGDNSRLIVGRITSVEQQPDGRATYEAKLYNTVAGRDIAALIDPQAPALRTTSVYGYWVGPTSETRNGGKRVEVGEDLAIDALDFTASPGVDQSRIDTVAFENHSLTLASIGESTLDGKSVCESYDATIEIDLVSKDELEVWERDFSTKQRKQMAAGGQAMAGGRYPIANKSDLRNAIRAVGRGNGDHNAIRKHIMKRASALGLTSMVPSNWGSDGSMKESAPEELADKLYHIESAGFRGQKALDILAGALRVVEGQVVVCVSDDNGNEIVKVCATNVDADAIKKAAKQAGRLASRIVDQNDSDAIDFDGDDQDDQADADQAAGTDTDADADQAAGANDGFVVRVGSDPVPDGNDYESVRTTMPVLEVKVDGNGGLDHFIQALLAVQQGTKPSGNKPEPAVAQETKEQESAVSETEKPAAAAAAVVAGLTEADMTKLSTLIGTSIAEAFAAAAAAKAEKKTSKSKPADTSNDSTAKENADKAKAEAVKESTVSAADLDKRLKEERDKTVAELRESLIKEHGLPARKGYRFGESDTDVTPTGDDLWDRRGEVWAQFFPWGQTQQAAAANTAA